MPAAVRASARRRAVVRFPMAPSVPSTGIRRQGSFLVRSLNCFESGLRFVHHADDRVPLRISDETGRRLPHVLSKITVADEDGPLHSPESLVITAAENLWTAINPSGERRRMMVAGFRVSQRTLRPPPCDGLDPRGGCSR